MSRRPFNSPLALYGHPMTWPAGRLRYDEARVLLGAAPGRPGHALGIDQATCSGWGVVELENRRCVLSGSARTPAERTHALADIGALPGFAWRCCLVVLEDHSFIPANRGIPARALLKLGEMRGHWNALLSLCDHPESHRILATPAMWRKVMGTRVHLPRQAWKAQARDWASALCGRPIFDDDEAEAIVMASWGAWDGLAKWATKTARGLSPRPALRRQARTPPR